jgi:hypothetical protein
LIRRRLFELTAENAGNAEKGIKNRNSARSAVSAVKKLVRRYNDEIAHIYIDTINYTDDWLCLGD